MQRNLPTAIITAAALALSVPAWAATEQVSVRVSYADLDVEQTAGRQALEQRIGRAADRICRYVSPFATMRMKRECRASALASVQPQLAMLYDARPLAEAWTDYAALASR